MALTSDQAHNLASAAFENYTLPETMVIEEKSGMTSETAGSLVEFSQRFFFYPDNDEDGLDSDDEFVTSTAYINARINLETGEIEEIYAIISDGGNLTGEFTDDNRKHAYEEAGLSEYLDVSTPNP